MVETNFAKIGLAAKGPVLRWTGSLYASHQIQLQWDCCFAIHFGEGCQKTSRTLQFADSDALEELMMHLSWTPGGFQVPYAWLGGVHESQCEKLQGFLETQLEASAPLPKCPQSPYLAAKDFTPRTSAWSHRLLLRHCKPLSHCLDF
jgi:hypothetical protein